MKSKSKKVTFVVQDHWSGRVLYIERRLDVSQELKAEGVSFSANEEAAHDVFEDMKDDTNLVKKLNLTPLESSDLSLVDISLISVLIASSGSIRPVQLTFGSSDIAKRRIANEA